MTHHSRETLANWIETHCRRVADELGGSFELTYRHTGDCFLTEPGPLVDVLNAAIETETGSRADLTTNGGTSDARFIKDHCPVIEFGLVGQTMHQVDEPRRADGSGKAEGDLRQVPAAVLL